MKIILSILTALTFVSPVVGGAQSLSSTSQLIDSTPPVLALVKANRAGITGERDKHVQLPIVPSGADTSSSGRGSRGYHALLGAVTGTLGGAALGAAGGAIYDRNAPSDSMIPASALFAVYGAVVGLVTGLVVGLVWPTK